LLAELHVHVGPRGDSAYEGIIMATTISSLDFTRDASNARQATREGPVFIVEHGQAVHVLMTIEHYEQLTGKPRTLAEMLAMPEGEDVDFDPPQLNDPLSRPADLS
jgi:hypothetical protein